MAKRKNQDKPRIGAALQCPKALEAISTILLDSEKKYTPVADRGWMTYDAEEVVDSLMRHLIARAAGEHLDPESGRPHEWHIATNAAILVELTEA